jgi:hypothetical protein
MTARILAVALILLAVFAPPARAEAGWRWPVDGEVATPYRNAGDPYASGQHRGIDIVAPAGSRVTAATGGVVTFAGSVGDAGLTVSIRTVDGRFDTSYLHLGSASVQRGDHVGAGDSIGTVGTSGRRSLAAAHLHFGVRDAGQRHAYRDPLTLLPPPPAVAPRPLQPIPVAAPAPDVLAPAPAPGVPATAPPLVAPQSLPLAEPRKAPEPRPLPAPGPVPEAPPVSPALPTLGPLAAPAAAPAPGSAPPRFGHHPSAPSAPSAPSTAGRAAAVRAPAMGSAPSAPRRLAPGRRHPGAAAPRTRAPGRGGVDLGWLAACSALVAAAALLGRPAGPRRAMRTTRALVAIEGRADR